VCKNSPVVREHHLAHITIGNSPRETREGLIDSGVLTCKLRDDVFFVASEQAGLLLAQDLVNTAVVRTFLSLFAPVGRSLALATRDTVLKVFRGAIETADG
jgi:hypothetical protein